jgi:hypothetical protein
VEGFSFSPLLLKQGIRDTLALPIDKILKGAVLRIHWTGNPILGLCFTPSFPEQPTFSVLIVMHFSQRITYNNTGKNQARRGFQVRRQSFVP